LSIELGEKMRLEAVDKSLQFSFVSDAPFRNRARPALSDFQAQALRDFRQGAASREYWRVEKGAGVNRMRLAVPVTMEADCVSCHNAHPDSPVRSWKVGDVRGIQDVSVDLAIVDQADQSGLLALYMVLFLGSGLLAVLESRANNARLRRINDELEISRAELEHRGDTLSQTIAELRTKTTVLDRAPFGILIAEAGSPGLRFTYVNQALCSQTGYLADELRTREETIAEVDAAIAEGRTCELELVIHRRDGMPLWTRIVMFPSFGTEGRLQHYVACISDISDIRRADEERQRLAGELHESLKLESLGLTIAGIAHDLNTPIGVAITASSLLEDSARRMAAEAAAATPAKDKLERFFTQAERSLALVRNNLNKAAVLVRSFKQTTADATREEWRMVDLKSFLDTLLVSVSPLMKRARCEVQVHCPASLVLRTEPGSLGRALTNLLVNASIHAFADREERRVRVDVVRTPGGVRISCSDNGVGMSEEAVTKAFTPFFTTRRGTGGSGLGLFSSRRAVEQVLGGRITLESRLGVGTVFHIDLPGTPEA
jgi:PAS domain S-box-containing protein